jgi:hypothetical protein
VKALRLPAPEHRPIWGLRVALNAGSGMASRQRTRRSNDVQESRAMPLNLPSPSLFPAMLTANVAVR